MTHALIILATVGPAFLTFYGCLRHWTLEQSSDEVGRFIAALVCGVFWPIALTAFVATRKPRHVRRAEAAAQEARLLAEREQLLGLTPSQPPKENP